jgi:photosystem II stability/assembly factor-like uncharacterized protein
MFRFSKIFVFAICLLFIQTINANWIKQSSNTLAWLHDVYFFDESKGFIAGSSGTFLETKNGGKTWAKRKNFTEDTILQIAFLDNSNGWLLCERNIYNRGASSSSYLLKTNDGGENWEKIEFKDSGRARITKIFFNANGKGFAIGENGTLLELHNDGQTWKKSTSPIRFLLLDGFFTDEKKTLLFGGSGSILFSDDLGVTWNNANVFGEKPAKFNAAFFINQKNGWAVGTNGKIFQTVSGGKTWREQTSGISNGLNDVFFLNTAEGFAVGNDGTILHTKTAGNIWVSEKTNIKHRLEKILFVGNKGFAVGFGGTILSYDRNPGSQNINKPILRSKESFSRKKYSLNLTDKEDFS